tara:strand:- start:26236 stop:26574 length:339 start_codon:yes stop_codon:yes gene_type:complete
MDKEEILRDLAGNPAAVRGLVDAVRIGWHGIKGFNHVYEIRVSNEKGTHYAELNERLNVKELRIIPGDDVAYLGENKGNVTNPAFILANYTTGATYHDSRFQPVPIDKVSKK